MWFRHGTMYECGKTTNSIRRWTKPATSSTICTSADHDSLSPSTTVELMKLFRGLIAYGGGFPAQRHGTGVASQQATTRISSTLQPFRWIPLLNQPKKKNYPPTLERIQTIYFTRITLVYLRHPISETTYTRFESSHNHNRMGCIGPEMQNTFKRSNPHSYSSKQGLAASKLSWGKSLNTLSFLALLS